ncbi:partial pantoate--beta-alanine ligase, partial [biofilm metagenome]
RTEHEDKQKLQDAEVDALFLPSVIEMYGNQPQTTVSVKNLSTLYCGAFRPGHFDGVATVVCKLFNMVKPDLAYFGLKDYQQLAIIRTMANDLNFAIEIKAVKTEREQSGLAMSSRNGYLSADEIKVAPHLYQALCAARDDVLQGDKPFETIEREALAFLQGQGFKTDYFSICRADSLLKADKETIELVILTAARLGMTRLIDNIVFSNNWEIQLK